jgi:putative membrane protein
MGTRKGWTILLITLTLPCAARAQDGGVAPAEPSRQSPSRERAPAEGTNAEILSRVHRANLLAIELGRLAMSRGEAPRLRRYGDLVVRDHSRVDKLVSRHTRRRGLVLTEPRPTSSIEEEQVHQRNLTLKRLQTLSGSELDPELLTAMLAAHEDAIQMLEEARTQVRDEQLRGLLTKVLPILKQHRRLAEHLGARKG